MSEAELTELQLLFKTTKWTLVITGKFIEEPEREVQAVDQKTSQV